MNYAPNGVSSQKTFVVFNPVAGKLDNDLIHSKLNQVLEKHQIPHDIHETEKGENLHRTVENAVLKGYERFLAVGGDGTVSGVASGLRGSHIPVVIIPTGTSNALAKVLGIPLQPGEICDWWLSAHKIKSIDAMQVGNQIYLLNISIGVSSKALSEVNRQDKRRLGSAAYYLRGLQQLAGISPYKFRITIDGETYHQGASEVIIANSGISQFKTIRLNPEIRLDDGIVSVCHIRARNILDYLRIAGKLISGHPEATRNLTCKDAQDEVHVHANQRLPIQADGELIGHTSVKVKLVPAAVDFLTTKSER
jgi:diacylglycerol kinase (ATP)